MAMIIGYDAADQPIYQVTPFSPAPAPVAVAPAAPAIDLYSATPTSPMPEPGSTWIKGYAPVSGSGSPEEMYGGSPQVGQPSGWSRPSQQNTSFFGGLAEAVKGLVTNPGFLLAVAPPLISSAIAAAPLAGGAETVGAVSSGFSAPAVIAPAAADLVAASAPVIAAPIAADFAGGAELASTTASGLSLGGGALSEAASGGIGGLLAASAGAGAAGITLGELASGAAAATKIAGSAATIAGAAAAVTAANAKAKTVSAASDLAGIQAFEDAAATVPSSSAAPGFWTTQNIVLASAAALGLAYFFVKG